MPASRKDLLEALESEIISCRKCPRLVAFREETARVRKKQFSHWKYWGNPVPGFGDPNATLLVVGLAPAAHGGNRTGRVFTGDRSGDFLIRALHRAGFSNQPNSTSRDDGLKLRGVYLTAAVKSAPPNNRPMTSEIANCSSYLAREIQIIGSVKAILCLGQIAFQSTLAVLKALYHLDYSTPRFRHGLELNLGKCIPRIFASYHPSPRNTQTGKLTEDMFLSLLSRVRRKIGRRT